MTGRLQTEGYNHLIQCPEVSSSSDPNFSLVKLSRRFPISRRSYRLELRPENPRFLPFPDLNVMAINQPVRNLNPIPVSTCSCLSNLSTRTALLSVCIIFLGSLLALSLVYSSFPNLRDNEKEHIKLPWNIEEAKNLGIVLDRYKKDHFVSVLTGVFLMYIFGGIPSMRLTATSTFYVCVMGIMHLGLQYLFCASSQTLQTFAIPGSIFLSILSGFLFNFYVALFLVCTCSALGASLCFLLSQLLGRRLIWIYFPDKAKEWAMLVNKHRDNLFNYIVFLRVTPFLPNWFINLTAPVIGVPLVPFAAGTFFGVAPPSFIAIQAGQTLHSMSATDSAFSWTSIFWLGVFAVVSLVPILLKKQLKEKFQ